MREKIVKLYQYAELSDAAKAKAREWYGRIVAEDYDAGCIYEDAATLAEFMGLDIRRRKIKARDGSKRWDVSIYYQLHCQSAGASFDGVWDAFKVQPGKLIEHAPQDAELARIAGEFERIAKAYPGAMCGVKANGHYMSMDFDIVIEPPENHDDVLRTPQEWTVINQNLRKATAALKEASRDFAHWIYKRIESAYEWQTSNEGILAEGIEANEYEFTADGKRES